MSLSLDIVRVLKLRLVGSNQLQTVFSTTRRQPSAFWGTPLGTRLHLLDSSNAVEAYYSTLSFLVFRKPQVMS